MALFVTLLLGKALWVQTDIQGLFRNGIVIKVRLLIVVFIVTKPSSFLILMLLIYVGTDFCLFIFQVAGLIGFSTRFFLTVMNMLNRLVAEDRPLQQHTSQSFRNQRVQSESQSRSTPDSSVSTERSECSSSQPHQTIKRRVKQHPQEIEIS